MSSVTLPEPVFATILSEVASVPVVGLAWSSRPPRSMSKLKFVSPVKVMLSNVSVSIFSLSRSKFVFEAVALKASLPNSATPLPICTVVLLKSISPAKALKSVLNIYVPPLKLAELPLPVDTIGLAIVTTLFVSKFNAA